MKTHVSHTGRSSSHSVAGEPFSGMRRVRVALISSLAEWARGQEHEAPAAAQLGLLAFDHLARAVTRSRVPDDRRSRSGAGCMS